MIEVLVLFDILWVLFFLTSLQQFSSISLIGMTSKAPILSTDCCKDDSGTISLEKYDHKYINDVLCCFTDSYLILTIIQWACKLTVSQSPLFSAEVSSYSTYTYISRGSFIHQQNNTPDNYINLICVPTPT